MEGISTAQRYPASSTRKRRGGSVLATSTRRNTVAASLAGQFPWQNTQTPGTTGAASVF